MCRLIFYFISFGFIFSGCNSLNEKRYSLGNESEKVNLCDSLTYNAINYLLIHKGVNPELITDTVAEEQRMSFPFLFKEDSLLLTEMNDIFSRKDVAFILSQKKTFDLFKINKSCIRGNIRLVTYPFDNIKSYSTISYPLYNLKKDVFIIRTTYICGSLCGHQGLYIYKWEGNNLRLLKILKQSVY